MDKRDVPILREAITEKTWRDFQNAGLLWWVNRALHLFGWVIVVESVPNTGEIVRAYPARTYWRGFSAEDEAEGFRKLTEELANNAPVLLEEVKS